MTDEKKKAESKNPLPSEQKDETNLLLKVKNPVVNLASPFCYKFM